MDVARSHRRAVVACVFCMGLAAACLQPPPDGLAVGDAGAAPADAGALPTDAGTGGEPDAPAPPTSKPIVIVMIGDGMGTGQLEVAGLYAHGAPGTLFIESLPVQGEAITSSLSGTTDSAAAATTMATGTLTINGYIGLDRDGNPVETLVQEAHRLGMAAGLVTTTTIPHATPAGFSAHVDSRSDYEDIAREQALVTRPEVMLGGGGEYFEGSADLVSPMQEEGYQVVRTRSELLAAQPAAGNQLVGLFAYDYMEYVNDLPPDSEQPSLAEMSLAALDFLDTNDRGFFVMIEGGRIDHGGHARNLVNTIHETLDFDAAVEAVAGWAEGRDVTLIVTADHECGGLEVVQAAPAGELPQVSWRWGQHTNARIRLFAQGPGTAVFDGEARDHRWVHAVASARLEGTALTEPPGVLLPDGHLADLGAPAAEQTTASGFGPGFNELDALRVAGDDYGLDVGVDGVFQWDENALVVLIDVDLGAGTGPAALAGALSDHSGRIDGILSSLSLDAPPLPGFGADLALVSFGGDDPTAAQTRETAGLRGLRPPYGEATNLAWLKAATNFGEGVRTRDTAIAAVAGEGYEAFLPWKLLYPPDGVVPAGARVGVAAVLVGDDGGFTSNQCLPPFPAGTENPGRTVVPLPGVAVWER